jgi:hypothetical protein
MKQRYILAMVCLWTWVCPVVAQSVLFAVQPTGVNHTIFIKPGMLPTANGAALEPGDVIGVFYDSLGVLACGGYVEWQGKPAFLVAYGEDGPGKGFRPGEVFQFKVWKKATNCLLENAEVTYAGGGMLTHSNQFAADGISELSSLSARASSVYYPAASLCGNAAKQTPITTGRISQVTFEAPPGLALDKRTGTIDPANSQPGAYTVTFHSPTCLDQASASILIAPTIDLSHLRMQFVDASCEKQTGSLVVEANSITGGKQPYRFTLQEVTTRVRIASANNEFALLDGGVYELTVTDAQGCQRIWYDEIRVTKKNDCIPVISPDNDGVADAFYIPNTGVARVYNRYGELKKTLIVPGEWYGNDESGNTVPMGSYVIICDNQRQRISITVVR